MTVALDAKTRLEDARAFLESAKIIDAFAEDDSFGDVIATNAIHAGIAASDVICLMLLGRHSKTDNQRDAISALKEASGDGAAAGRENTGRL